MKTPNLLKKIDSRVIQILVLLAIVGLFVYVFYYQYNQFREYSANKNVENRQDVENPPMEIPEFFNFNVDDEPDTLKFMLFTFDKSKAKPSNPAISSNSNAGSGNYVILGVVKRDRLYLLVRFSAGNKIQLYSEGMSIDGKSRVDRLSTDQVTLVDESGKSQTHKIFQTTFRVDASAAEKNVNNPPAKKEYIPPPPPPKPKPKFERKEVDNRQEQPNGERRREEMVDEEAPPPDGDVPVDGRIEKPLEKRSKRNSKDKKDKNNSEKQNDGS